LCERDVNVKVIQTVMGHASINITMDIYAEVSKAKQFEEIDRLADELDVF
jgi:integrase